MKGIPSKDRGQGLLEYAMILTLVAVVAVLILSTLGTAVGEVLSTVVDELNAPGSIGGGGEPAPDPPPDPDPPPVCYGSGLLPSLILLMGTMLVYSSWQASRRTPVLVALER